MFIFSRILFPSNVHKYFGPKEVFKSYIQSKCPVMFALINSARCTLNNGDKNEQEKIADQKKMVSLENKIG